MKHLTLIVGALVIFSNQLFAKIITVSNRINSPGQFTTMQEAIDSASAGDTILVMGSPDQYQDVTVEKKITLFGQGYAPQKEAGFPTRVGSITIKKEGKGSVICGFMVNYLTIESFEDYVVIFRNRIESLGVNRNCLVRENVVRAIGWLQYGWGWEGKPPGNIYIENNIIGSGINMDGQGDNILIKNNFFTLLDNGQNYVIFGSGMIISNNIFYRKGNSVDRMIIHADNKFCQVNNNIYFNITATNPFSIGTGSITGSGNLFVDPKVTKYELSDQEPIFNDDLRLKPDSPAKNAGTDGSDIGPYGGTFPLSYPLTGHPPIPLINSMELSNSVVPPNGNLKIKLKSTIVN